VGAFFAFRACPQSSVFGSQPVLISRPPSGFGENSVGGGGFVLVGNPAATDDPFVGLLDRRRQLCADVFDPGDDLTGFAFCKRRVLPLVSQQIPVFASMLVDAAGQLLQQSQHSFALFGSVFPAGPTHLNSSQ